MLLKCSTLDQKKGTSTIIPSKGIGKGKGLRSSSMKMTVSTGSSMVQRAHRKVLRIPSKRYPGKALPGKLHSMTRIGPGKITPGKRIIPRPNPPPCDNSNDSGLGFDHHVEMQYHSVGVKNLSSLRSGVSDVTLIDDRKIVKDVDHDHNDDDGDDDDDDKDDDDDDEQIIAVEKKRRKIVHLESDDTCSNDGFIFAQQKGTPTTASSSASIVASNTSVQMKLPPTTTNPTKTVPRPSVRRSTNGLINLQSQIAGISKSGNYQLQILAQPEQQHRARYQTEGSRGAVKDRSGNGFPIVKLVGYEKPTVLQVFIGTDIGRVAPHMFYQACKVSGKNSTPCLEKKLDGTMVIELELKPENDMKVICDCVGILKERNVDVEHRFPDQSTPRSKKKSTRCRMVFRTQIVNADGTVETIQVCSQQIICTQPPGIPEICKKSLTSCPATGGLELFIIGKNFSKDTRVVFQSQKIPSGEIVWQEMVSPDKEYLQQTHLICTVPPYINPEIVEPITVQLFIAASGKKSEAHNFIYTPNGSHGILALSTARPVVTMHTSNNNINNNNNINILSPSSTSCSSTSPSSTSSSSSPLSSSSPTTNASQQDMQFSDDNNKNGMCPVMLWSTTPMETKHEISDSGMMPPPTALPINVRRPSSLAGKILTDQLSSSTVVSVSSPIGLKSELLDENSQNSLMDSSSNSNDSMDRFQDQRTDNEMDLYTRKMVNMKMIEDRSNLSMMVNDNSMDIGVYQTSHMMQQHSNGNLSPQDLKEIDLRVKQEQMAAQLQQFVNGNDAQSQILPTQSVEKFLSNIKSHVDNVSIYAGNGVVVTQQSQSPQQQSQTNTDVMFAQQLSTMNHMNSSTNGTMGQTYSGNLMTSPNVALAIKIDSLVDTNTDQIMGNVSSPTSATNRSPLAQDIILNSQSASVLQDVNQMNAISAAPNPSQQSEHNMSPDIILNSTVSPTMLCSSSASHNSMLDTQVSMLSNIQMPQNSQESLLSAIISPIMSQQTDSVQTPPTASATVVQNMILNAAAEILKSQQTSSSTIDALMSLDSAASILNEQQSQQMIITTGTTASSSTSSSSATVTVQNTVQQQQHHQQDSLCRGNQQQQQQSQQQQQQQQQHQQQMDQHMPMFNESSVIHHPMLANSVDLVRQSSANMLANINGLVPSQLLSNHEMRNVVNEELKQMQQQLNNEIRQEIQNAVTQESLLQTVSLVPNDIIIPSTVEVAKVELSTNVSHQQSSVNTTIPQEIATMSDHDLISYINPSCFDQEFQ